MTVPRVIALLLVLGGLALSVVQFRSEQTRCAARVAQLQSERLTLRRKSWAIQMELSRLRTPEQIRDRVERMRLPVMSPHQEDVKVVHGD